MLCVTQKFLDLFTEILTDTAELEHFTPSCSYGGVFDDSFITTTLRFIYLFIYSFTFTSTTYQRSDWKIYKQDYDYDYVLKHAKL